MELSQFVGAVADTEKASLLQIEHFRSSEFRLSVSIRCGDLKRKGLAAGYLTEENSQPVVASPNDTPAPLKALTCYYENNIQRNTMMIENL